MKKTLNILSIILLLILLIFDVFYHTNFLTFNQGLTCSMLILSSAFTLLEVLDIFVLEKKFSQSWQLIVPILILIHWFGKL